MTNLPQLHPVNSRRILIGAGSDPGFRVAAGTGAKKLWVDINDLIKQRTTTNTDNNMNIGLLTLFPFACYDARWRTAPEAAAIGCFLGKTPAKREMRASTAACGDEP
jgi:hypothetical protein